LFLITLNYNKRMDIETLIESLKSKEHDKGYEALNILLKESEKSPSLYRYFDEFSLMLSSDNSYIRTRSLLLIGSLAKWDISDKIEPIIDNVILNIDYKNPICSRIAIKVLIQIAKEKPNLKEIVKASLQNIDTRFYSPSMAPLIEKDIKTALKATC